jgi:hypothetical protein
MHCLCDFIFSIHLLHLDGTLSKKIGNDYSDMDKAFSNSF